jgi:acyl-CoA synthetase (AMP-forming)/AMP-acid ligase II
VEGVIKSLEGVFDAAVIALPDPKWGEKVVAVVIPKGELTSEAVIGHCRDRMAGFKKPKDVFFIEEDEMPLTATGTILHRIHRERYSA